MSRMYIGATITAQLGDKEVKHIISESQLSSGQCKVAIEPMLRAMNEAFEDHRFHAKMSLNYESNNGELPLF